MGVDQGIGCYGKQNIFYKHNFYVISTGYLVRLLHVLLHGKYLHDCVRTSP